MEYEYKESIKEMIESYVISESEELKMKAELDLVYAQAEKSDDYEVKAKAFDAICKAHVPLEYRMSPVTIDEGLDFAEETENIILKFYESGERNES